MFAFDWPYLSPKSGYLLEQGRKQHTLLLSLPPPPPPPPQLPPFLSQIWAIVKLYRECLSSGRLAGCCPPPDISSSWLVRHNPVPKAHLPEGSLSASSREHAKHRVVVLQQVSLSLALFLHFDPLSWNLFRCAHHQPDESLLQQPKSCSFCPSWWEKSLPCNMAKIRQAFLSPRKGSQRNSSQLVPLQDSKFTAVLCSSLLHFFLFYFLFFPTSFKLLPLCTSEFCWSQRSNRLETYVQVKWLHLWPQTIPPWEHLICSNQKYFYFNEMLFAWGKLCGSPSDVFSFYHFVEKCINPFCFTSGIFF